MYKNYVFDLYGTLVDIHTDEEPDELWEKMSLFYGYYGAVYTPGELRTAYAAQVSGREAALKGKLSEEPKYAHESYPEIRIEEVFRELYRQKGVEPDDALAVHTGQFFRVLSTDYVRLYEGADKLLANLRAKGGKVWLLSNAQRIFTAFELNYLDITKYFDGIMISSDYNTKKPDGRFYEALFEKYGVKPEESIMIGNDARCDIGGAAAVGMDTFYIRSNISPADDVTPECTYHLEEMDMAKVTQILLGE